MLCAYRLMSCMNPILKVECVDLRILCLWIYYLGDLKILINDVRNVAASSFDFGAIWMVPNTVVRNAVAQHCLALYRSIQRKA